MTSVMSLIMFTSVVDLNSGQQREINFSLGKELFFP